MMGDKVPAFLTALSLAIAVWALLSRRRAMRAREISQAGEKFWHDMWMRRVCEPISQAEVIDIRVGVRKEMRLVRSAAQRTGRTK